MKYLIIILFILLTQNKVLLANNILIDNNPITGSQQKMNYFPVNANLFLNEFLSTFNKGDFIRSFNRIIDKKELKLEKLDFNLGFNLKELDKKHSETVNNFLFEVEKKSSLISNNFFTKLEYIVNANNGLNDIIYFEIRLNDYFRQNAINVPLHNQSVYMRKIELINFARYEIFISYLAKRISKNKI